MVPARGDVDEEIDSASSGADPMLLPERTMSQGLGVAADHGQFGAAITGTEKYVMLESRVTKLFPSDAAQVCADCSTTNFRAPTAIVPALKELLVFEATLKRNSPLPAPAPEERRLNQDESEVAVHGQSGSVMILKRPTSPRDAAAAVCADRAYPQANGPNR
jgi:hypothetical protein